MLRESTLHQLSHITAKMHLQFLSELEIETAEEFSDAGCRNVVFGTCERCSLQRYRYFMCQRAVEQEHMVG